MTRGRFITFEGLDGSGKSTHLRECASRLRDSGLDVVATKEPGGTELGDAIRALFLDPRRVAIEGGVELLLVFASRRQHLIEVIDPALERGAWVLCDRFTDSTHAYQGAGRGVPRERIAAIDEAATGTRRPDRTLLFDLPAEVARGRGQSEKRRSAESFERGIDRIDREDLEFYRRVRQGYLELLSDEPERFVRIDSSGPVEQTRSAVRQALDRLLLEQAPATTTATDRSQGAP
ncbi:MAG: dTMP kinase [Acidobacteria bacterium]|nr:MAG: dTMP kinase [Acidobacteriota bacterium]REK12100.1 MAG: dTMP kinase [Acidobacteriota bacterium]